MMNLDEVEEETKYPDLFETWRGHGGYPGRRHSTGRLPSLTEAEEEGHEDEDEANMASVEEGDTSVCERNRSSSLPGEPSETRPLARKRSTSKRRKKDTQFKSNRLHEALNFLATIPLGTITLKRSGKQRRYSSGGTQQKSSTNASAAAATTTSDNIKGHGQNIDSVALSANNSAIENEYVALDLSYKLGHSKHAFVPLCRQIGIRIPGHKYKEIRSHGQAHTVEFRRALINDGVLQGRLIFSMNKGYPTMVSSILSYDRHKERQRRISKRKGIDLLAKFGRNVNAPVWLKWRGTSYASLVKPTWGMTGVNTDISTVEWSQGMDNAQALEIQEKAGERKEKSENEETLQEYAQTVATLIGISGHYSWKAQYPYYRPFELDDPGIDFDKGRTILNEEAYTASILSYRSDKAKKRDINEAFRQRHPWLSPSLLTLSKIRKLRRLGAWIWKVLDLELGTMALAFAYFEKCIWQGIVDKFNRKLIYVCCFVLAYKFNEPVDSQRRWTEKVVPEVEKVFMVTWKDVQKYEFAVWVALGFSLHLHLGEVIPHVYNISRDAAVDLAEYFAETTPTAKILAAGQYTNDAPVYEEFGLFGRYNRNDEDEQFAFSAEIDEKDTQNRYPFYSPLSFSLGVRWSDVGKSTATAEGRPRGYSSTQSVHSSKAS